MDFTPHPRVTAVVDLVTASGELFGGGALGFVTFGAPGPWLVGGVCRLTVQTKPRFISARRSSGTWPVTCSSPGNVLGSLANDGLRATLIPVVGLDWAFSR